MARTKAPLMSLDASGSLAHAITFSKWKGRTYVRKTVKPANPKSGLQVGMRAGLKFNAQNYTPLSAAIKANWLASAKKRKITGLDAMVALNQVRTRQDKGLKQDPTVAEAAVEAAPTVPVATAQPKSVKLTWVDSAGAADWATLIYMSTLTGFTPAPANLIQIIVKGVQLYTAVKLTTGTPYYFKLRGTEKGGTAGTLTAEITTTPT